MEVASDPHLVLVRATAKQARLLIPHLFTSFPFLISSNLLREFLDLANNTILEIEMTLALTQYNTTTGQ
jgi:hypothetical protein